MSNHISRPHTNICGLTPSPFPSSYLVEGNNRTSQIWHGKFVTESQAVPSQIGLPDGATIRKKDEGILGISSIVFLLQKCIRAKDLCQGKRIHKYIIDYDLENRFMCNCIINMYGKCGALQDARAVFDKMRCPNCVSWNIMIKSYISHGLIQLARELFEQMPRKSVVSWNTMVSAYAMQGDLQEALHLFQQMPQRDVISWNAMIAGYSEYRHLREAEICFQHMPQKNQVSWNSMISAYAQHNLLPDAFQFFLLSPLRDRVSWNTMITAYSQHGHLKEALYFLQQMPQRDVLSWNAMITGYVQHGQMENAFQMFQKMPEKDVVSWNAMISGYAQQGQLDEALQFFELMQNADVMPNEITFISILDACTSNAALSKGKWIHRHVRNSRYYSFTSVHNSLINMYAKCGSIDEALALFETMVQKNVISWNGMLAAYANHGDAKKAIEVIEQMNLDSLRPNEVTFNSLLSACGHAGMLREGCHFFTAISGVYKITPTLQHFNCIVDLLRRIELLQEAENLICNMPFQPETMSWKALIGSHWKSYSDELLKRTANLILELDPENPSSYVLVSNIFAHASEGIVAE